MRRSGFTLPLWYPIETTRHKPCWKSESKILLSRILRKPRKRILHDGIEVCDLWFLERVKRLTFIRGVSFATLHERETKNFRRTNMINGFVKQRSIQVVSSILLISECVNHTSILVFLLICIYRYTSIITLSVTFISILTMPRKTFSSRVNVPTTQYCETHSYSFMNQYIYCLSY